MKLKPCPFCGNTNLIAWKTGDGYEIKCRFILDKPYKKGKEIVEVGGCGGRMITFMPDEFPKGITTLEKLYKFCERECVKLWNTRWTENEYKGTA